jgi:hypothetical protein
MMERASREAMAGPRFVLGANRFALILIFIRPPAPAGRAGGPAGEDVPALLALIWLVVANCLPLLTRNPRLAA